MTIKPFDSGTDNFYSDQKPVMPFLYPNKLGILPSYLPTSRKYEFRHFPNSFYYTNLITYKKLSPRMLFCDLRVVRIIYSCEMFFEICIFGPRIISSVAGAFLVVVSGVSTDNFLDH